MSRREKKPACAGFSRRANRLHRRDAGRTGAADHLDALAHAEGHVRGLGNHTRLAVVQTHRDLQARACLRAVFNGVAGKGAEDGAANRGDGAARAATDRVTGHTAPPATMPTPLDLSS